MSPFPELGHWKKKNIYILRDMSDTCVLVVKKFCKTFKLLNTYEAGYAKTKMFECKNQKCIPKYLALLFLHLQLLNIGLLGLGIVKLGYSFYELKQILSLKALPLTFCNYFI